MCWLVYKPAGIEMDMDKMDIAQTHNEDGYGVAWYEPGLYKQKGLLQVVKTMDYERFKEIVSSLDDVDAVIHLRKTSRGTTQIENNHPFYIPNGVMFHNGTIHGITCEGGCSDTKTLASILDNCVYEYIDDILPLIKQIVGDTLNKLVFFEDDGTVTIVNEELGVWEDEIWYSNTYHHKEKEYANNYTPWKQSSDIKSNKVRVFVYGTLKKGLGNHGLLSGSKFIGTAHTVSKWIMIGESLAFPYVLRRDGQIGKQIKGEVYEVDSSTLKRLDQLEGVPTHYKRINVYVEYDNKETSENVAMYVKADGETMDLRGMSPIEEFNPVYEVQAV
jgi:gamma-glutamylcyclotransferase (GGCT)/AIG2-like uncharacterized protein YtfP